MPHPNKPAGVRRGDPLTEREREILALLSNGSSTADIAARLGIRDRTVRRHATNVYTKIGAQRESNALTPRELEILALLAAGNATADIAEQLVISTTTVKSHLTSVYKKIGATNRVQAARYYLDHLAGSSEAQ